VGRQEEIRRLERHLDHRQPGALLLQANYGSGKTHLLRYIRETALDKGFAVSLIALDARSAVRFNRMDQILGAICRHVEVPQDKGGKGIRCFLNAVCEEAEAAKGARRGSDFWRGLTNDWQWDYSDRLDSPGMYVALRAWATGGPDVRDRIEDWLCQPWQYTSQRMLLYLALVANLRRSFRDPRGDWQFYQDGVFVFNVSDYSQSWAALRDLHRLSIESGMKGFIVLVDEFEDVINNLNRIDYQQKAFWNLFQFYSGRLFPGMSFFAVTPDFVEKCKQRLLLKGCWDYDYSRFERLPSFQMSPLEAKELKELALRIMETHGIAFNWEPDTIMKARELYAIVERAASVQVQDRARHTIREVVQSLDRLLEERE
jgi:hypothetical protein